MRAHADGQYGGFGFTRNFNRGTEEFSEGFDAGNEARARPRKIAVGFEGVDSAVSNGRNGVPRLRE